MKKIFFFSAILMVALVTSVTSNCTADDEWSDNSSEYTSFAKRKQLRAVKTVSQTVADSTHYNYWITLKRVAPNTGHFTYEAYITVMFSHTDDGKPKVDLIDYLTYTNLCDVNKASLRLDTDHNNNTYILCVEGTDYNGFASYGEFDSYTFIL